MGIETGALMAGATVLSLATTAVGTGLSYYAQQQQAQNAERMAQYNYEIQRQNAEINAKMAAYQADVNTKVAMSQYQAGQNNAAALEGQATAAEAQGRERARRMREENQRMLALQRSRYGKAGVTSEGTPLAVMAETAGNLELGVQDAAFETELESRTFRRRADMERYQSGFSLLDAGVQQYQAAASQAGRKIALRQAEINRIAGRSEASGIRTASYGTLIAGAGQMANTAYRAI